MSLFINSLKKYVFFLLLSTIWPKYVSYFSWLIWLIFIRVKRVIHLQKVSINFGIPFLLYLHATPKYKSSFYVLLTYCCKHVSGTDSHYLYTVTFQEYNYEMYFISSGGIEVPYVRFCGSPTNFDTYHGLECIQHKKGDVCMDTILN